MELDIQRLLGVRQDLATHVAVAFQTASVHTRQHENVAINVVVHLNDSFAIVLLAII